MNSKTKNIIIITIGIILIGLIVLLAVKQTTKKSTKTTTQQNIQHTEKLYKERIRKITLNYYGDYNISTAKYLNEENGPDFVKQIQLEIKGNDLRRLTKMLSTLREDKSYYECDCEINDEAELIINDEYRVIIGHGYGQAGYINDENPKVVGISNELYSYVMNLMEK